VAGEWRTRRIIVWRRWRWRRPTRVPRQQSRDKTNRAAAWREHRGLWWLMVAAAGVVVVAAAARTLSCVPGCRRTPEERRHSRTRAPTTRSRAAQHARSTHGTTGCLLPPGTHTEALVVQGSERERGGNRGGRREGARGPGAIRGQNLSSVLMQIWCEAGWLAGWLAGCCRQAAAADLGQGPPPPARPPAAGPAAARTPAPRLSCLPVHHGATHSVVTPQPAARGGDDRIDRHNNWLRFPCDSTFVRSHDLHPHPYPRLRRGGCPQQRCRRSAMHAFTESTGGGGGGGGACQLSSSPWRRLVTASRER
jgi:hypothetical protein